MNQTFVPDQTSYAREIYKQLGGSYDLPGNWAPSLTNYLRAIYQLLASGGGGVGPSGPQIIQVADQATALLQSAANPGNLYIWE